jgi:hypothetical protein
MDMNNSRIFAYFILVLSMAVSAVALEDVTQEYLPSGDVELSFSSTPGECYQVQYCTNLIEGAWFDWGVAIEAEVEETVLLVAVSETVCFFRVVKAPEATSAEGEIIDFCVSLGSAELTFASVVGERYQVQCCTNLAENVWSDVGYEVDAVATSTVESADASSASCFFRVIEASEPAVGIIGGPPDVPGDTPDESDSDDSSDLVGPGDPPEMPA